MKQFALIFILSLFTNFVAAQVPEKAEDISPLLVGENVPEAVLMTPEGKSTNFSAFIKEKPSIIIECKA